MLTSIARSCILAIDLRQEYGNMGVSVRFDKDTKEWTIIIADQETVLMSDGSVQTEDGPREWADTNEVQIAE